MRASTLISTLAVAASAVYAQERPANVSMCDYYTTALFNVSNSTTQYTLLTALVNTAVIGNYSKDAKVAVTGIVNNGTINGTSVSLLKYFDGMLASTNRGGEHGVSVNFLDGGGATPLMKNMPANDTMSNQYFLLTHLYEYFGALLNCSAYGKNDFMAYGGDASQYEVHKFMDLSYTEVSYFIQEVGLAAVSFGVTESDAMAVGQALNKLFNYRCSPATTVIPAQGSQLQSICIASDCPQAPDANCAAYKQQAVMPSPSNSSNVYTSKTSSMAASGTAGGSGGSGTASGSAAGSSSTGGSSSAGVANAVGAVLMGGAGLAALAVGL